MMPAASPPTVQSNAFSNLDDALEWSKEQNLSPRIKTYLKKGSTAASQPQLDHVLTNIVFPELEGVGSISQTSCLLSRATKLGLSNDLKTMVPTPNPPAFEIKAMSTTSHGLGLFASKDIGPGEIILTERPVVVLPGFIWLDGVNDPQDEVFTPLFDRIPVRHREDAYKMKNIHEDCSIQEGIMRTNGLALLLNNPSAEEAVHLGLFLTMGHCNHSCAPNAVWVWNRDTFSLTLYAVRKVPQDEEITISYIDPIPDTSNRQEKLKNSYHFKCTCSQCAASKKPHARKSLRAWIKNSTPPFEEWLHNLAGAKRSQVADKRKETAAALQLLRAEKLQCLRSTHRDLTDWLVKLDGALGNRGAFQKSLADTIEAWSIDAGWSSQAAARIKEYERWLKEPTAFLNLNKCK